MKSILAITIASIYGLSIRLMFGFFGDYMGVMSVTFLMLVPMVVGFLTIRLSPNRANLTSIAAFFRPWLTSLAILVLTMVLNIEGAICWIMIFPLFAVLAGLGGLIAFKWKKKKEQDEDILDNARNNTLGVSAALFIPLVLGAMEGERGLQTKHYELRKEVLIAASAEKVWQTIARIETIRPKEKKTYFSNAMGFPSHTRTTLDTFAVGGRRVAYYEKGLYFEETITALQKEKYLELAIKTDPTKIPPTVLDEHIVIGGKHVDVLQDTYRLESLPDGTRRLSLTSKFYINTPFNWYAGIWAEYLMADLLSGELDMIKTRAELR